MNRQIRLIHCSYHKCLTVYFKRVMHTLFNRLLPMSTGYRHFRSDLEGFYKEHGEYRLSSLNNHCLDLDRLGDFRMTRFIRDPRDLVVSGYFYHKKGAEQWTRVPNPTDEDFAVVNGCVPEGLRPNESYQEFLNRVSKERGLIAEIQFRRKHFESMLAWPEHDPRIRVFKYEDVLADGPGVFREIMRHYELGPLPRTLAACLARVYSASGGPFRHRHIRDPRSGQWREHFTQAVHDRLIQWFPDLLK